MATPPTDAYLAFRLLGSEVALHAEQGPAASGDVARLYGPDGSTLLTVGKDGSLLSSQPYFKFAGHAAGYSVTAQVATVFKAATQTGRGVSFLYADGTAQLTLPAGIWILGMSTRWPAISSAVERSINIDVMDPGGATVLERYGDTHLDTPATWQTLVRPVIVPAGGTQVRAMLFQNTTAAVTPASIAGQQTDAFYGVMVSRL